MIQSDAFSLTFRPCRKGFKDLWTVRRQPFMMRRTYKNPVAKMAVMRIFFLSGMRSFQTHGIGSMRMIKAEITLKIPLA